MSKFFSKLPFSEQVGAFGKRAYDSFLSLPNSAKLGAAGLLGFVVFLTVLFLGTAIERRGIFPAGPFGAIDAKVSGLFSGKQSGVRAATPKLGNTTLESSLLNLDLNVGIVEIGRNETGRVIAENGGGLTSFGKDVLLLPYDGNIYAASSRDTIRKTSIEAPDNNRSAYLQAAENPQNAEYDIHPGYLRYHDILRVDLDAGQALLASYTEFHADDFCVTNTVARLDLASSIGSIDDVTAKASDWAIIYRSSPCLPFKKRLQAMEGHMAGGKLVFQPPSSVFMTAGDYHFDGMRSDGAPIAQDPTAEYGKIMKIDLETNSSSIYSTGHRNMQGITVGMDDRLFSVEHGPQGGDEFNEIKQGLNYGWPIESYGTTYHGGQIPGSVSFGDHQQFESPLYAWVPSVAISDMLYVDGFHEHWDGDFLVGSLIGKTLYRIRMRNDRVVLAEPIVLNTRIRDLHLHTNGQIVIWTDNEELIFMSPKEREDTEQHFKTFIASSTLSDPAKNRLQTSIERCAECHSFGSDNHQKAPALGRMFGNDIAATAYPNYSDALAAVEGVWDREALKAYLSNPDAFAPGTYMAGADLDGETLDALVDYLEYIDGQF